MIIRSVGYDKETRYGGGIGHVGIVVDDLEAARLS
jgi:hypothetical protein